MEYILTSKTNEGNFIFQENKIVKKEHLKHSRKVGDKVVLHLTEDTFGEQIYYEKLCDKCDLIENHNHCCFCENACNEYSQWCKRC